MSVKISAKMQIPKNVWEPDSQVCDILFPSLTPPPDLAGFIPDED
jgi:hypothetical protein